MKSGPKLAGQVILAVAFIGCVYLAFCYVHDAMYFRVIGEDWAPLASFADSVRYSIIWVPFIAAILSLVLVFWVSAPEEEDRNPTKLDKAIVLLVNLFPFLALPSTIWAIGIRPAVIPACFIVLTAWIMIQGLLFAPARVRAFKSNYSLKTIVACSSFFSITAFLLMSMALGAIDGVEDFGRGRGIQIEMTNASPAERYVRMVRAFQGGLLVRQGDSLQFLPWSSIASFSAHGRDQDEFAEAPRSVLKKREPWYYGQGRRDHI